MLKWKRFAIVEVIGGAITIVSRLGLKMSSIKLPISPLIYTLIGLGLTSLVAILVSIEDY